MKNPLVSIIIPVYNVEEYLGRCLDSVVNQTYQNIEIVLIDDGSVDQSKSISVSYAERDSRIKFISKENEGQGAARNLGVQVAKGEYLAFLDSDDWIELTFVEKMLKHALIFGADVVTCDISFAIFNDGKVSEATSRLRFNSQDVVYPKLDKHAINKSRVFLWGKLYRMEFFRGLDLVQPSHPYEDLCITPLIIAKANKLVHIPEPLIHYFRNRVNNTVDNVDYLFFVSKALNRLFENFRQNGLFDEYYTELKIFAYGKLRVALNKHVLLSNDDVSFKKLQKELYGLMECTFDNWVNIFEMKCLAVGPNVLKDACNHLLFSSENLIHISDDKFDCNIFYDVDWIVVDRASKEKLDSVIHNKSAELIFVDCNLSGTDSETISWNVADEIFHHFNNTSVMIGK